MFKGISIILEGSPHTFFKENLMKIENQEESYEKARRALIKEYTSEEKKRRLLDEWRTVDLVDWNSRFAELSEVDVFKKCVDRLMQIQRQLDEHYQKDIFLRDQLIFSVSNIEDIKLALKQIPPNTSAEAKDRIGSYLSAEPSSAGSSSKEGQAFRKRDDFCKTL